MDLTRQTDYWNKDAAGREFTTPLDPGLIRSFLRKEARIIDYGCGYGRTLNELHELGYTNLAGYDISSELIARGKKEFPHLDLQLLGPEGVPKIRESADLVLLFAVLTCIVEDGGIRKTLENIKSIMRPAGYLLINDFLVNDDMRNRDRYARYREKYGVYGVFELPDGVVLRHFQEKDILDLLGDFTLVKYSRNRFRTMNGNEVTGFTALLSSK